MQLTTEQTEIVKKWVEDGAGLSEVQRRINEEFGLPLTYMDTRFLVLDIGASIKDKEPPKPKETPKTMPQQEDKLPMPSDDMAEPEPEDFEAIPQASVSVTLDKIVRAGALASGTVTFSNNVVVSWLLDRMGRLAFTKSSDPNYQPTQEELEAFQMELQTRLSQGY